MRAQARSAEVDGRARVRQPRNRIAIGLIVLATAVIVAKAWAAAGTLDLTFADKGRLTIDFGNSSFERANAVALQPDGKIVVAGVESLSTRRADFAIARVNTNGALDPSFAGDGMRTVAIGRNRDDEAEALAIQPDGKILVAGDSNAHSVVVRLKPDGTLDKTFSADGRASVGRDLIISGIGLQTDGRIAVAGTKFSSLDQFAVALLTPSGDRDRDFAGDGLRTISFPSPDGFSEGVDLAGGMTVLRNGKIVVAGNSLQSGAGVEVAIARVKSHGKLDRDFGSDGRTTVGFGHQTDAVGEAVTVHAGKVVVSGAVAPNSSCRFAVLRLKARGRLDRDFSKNGKRTVDFGGHSSIDDCGAFAVETQEDGKIVLAGESPRVPDRGNDLGLARLRPNGMLDQTFGTDGRVTIGFDNGARLDWGSGLAIQPDGKLVVAGMSQQMDGQRFALARFNGH